MEHEDICESCETLKQQLEIERHTNKELLKAILPKETIPQEIQMPQPIQPRTVPWHVRQQMLEAEDRRQNELLKAKANESIDSKKSTEELEAELLEEVK